MGKATEDKILVTVASNHYLFPFYPLKSSNNTFRLKLPLLLLLLTASWMAPSLADSPPFAWGETTHVADAGWGRMIALEDGQWLCVNNLYPKPNSILQLEISTDKARTWTPLTTVAEPGRNLDNGEIIQLADGTLRLTCRSVIDKRDPGANLSYHLPVYQSADGGKTWTFLSQIDTNEQSNFQPGQPSQGLWEPHSYLVADGRLACAYANEKHSAETPPSARPAPSKSLRTAVRPGGQKSYWPRSREVGN